MGVSVPKQVRGRAALATSLWVFGLATTVLLIGLWGRAVTVDRDTLEHSAHAALATEDISDRIAEWMSDAIGGFTTLTEEEYAGIVARIRARPESQLAVDRIVDRFVAAVLTPRGEPAELEVADALRPLVPAIVFELERVGVLVERHEVTAGIDQVAAVTIESEAEPFITGVASDATRILTQVVFLALVVMALSGASALLLSKQRVRMARGLAIRVGVSALTFGLLLRIGSWALDPDGGRSPIAAGGSVILGSNLKLLLAIGLGASAAATVGTAVLRRRRRAGPGGLAAP